MIYNHGTTNTAFINTNGGVGFDVPNSTFFVDATNHRVGMGTSAPVTSFVSTGNTVIGANALYTGASFEVHGSSDFGNGGFTDPNNGVSYDAKFGGVSGIAVRGQSYFAGNVGIGTTNPGTKLSILDSASTATDIFSATASAITSGNMIKLGEGGDQTFSGNGILMDFDNKGGGDLAFTGNFLKFNKANTTKFTVDNAGNISSPGAGTQLTLGSVVLSDLGTGRFLRGTNSMTVQTTDGSSSMLVGNIGSGENAYLASTGGISLRPDTIVGFATASVTFDSSRNAPTSTTMTFNNLRNDGAKSAIIRTSDFTSAGQAPVNLFIFAGSELGTPTQGNLILAHDGTNARGNVGIGVTNPATLLHIKATDPVLRIDDSGSGTSATLDFRSNGTTKGKIAWGNAANALDIYDPSNTLSFRFKADNNVLMGLSGGKIGISSNASLTPTSLLHVTGAVIGKALAIFDETGDQALFTASASGSPRFKIEHNGDVTLFGAPASNTTRILSLKGGPGDQPGNNVLDIQADGDSPTQGGRIQMGGVNSTLKGIITDFDSSTVSTSATYNIRSYNGTGTPTSRFLINEAGNVGIGTTSPAKLLEVSAATGPLAGIASFVTPNMSNGQLSYIDIGNSATNSNAFYLAYIHNTVAANRVFSIQGYESGAGPSSLALTAAGSVGIGTTSPVSKLHLTGAVVGKALAIFDETGDQALFTASASGTTKVTIDHSGNLTVNGATSPLVVNYSGNGAATIHNTAGTGFITQLGLLQDQGGSVGNYGTFLNTNATTSDFSIVTRTAFTDTTRFTLQNSNGYAGIGVTNPTNRLDVSDSLATASAMIRNTSTNAGIAGLAIKLSSTTLDNTSRFINFLDLNGTIIGKVQAANTTSVNYAANGTDMAEYFTKDSSVFTPGDLVSQGTNGATLTTSQYDSKMIGIVSTAPSFTGGIEGPNKVLVALVGQVPVKISSTSQPINPGDYITSSSEAGRGMKAINPGYTIGKALEAWDSASGKTTINVAIHNSYFEGDLSGQIAQLKTDVANLTTDISLLKLSTSSATVATNSATFKDLTVLGNTVLADTVVNGKLNVGTMILDNINNSIDAIGTLRLQPRALGDIEFEGGNLIIDQSGNINIKKGHILGNDSFRGSVVIKAGTTSAQVTQTTPWNSIPSSVTVTASYNTNVWVSNKTTTGFTINVSTPPTSDQSVDWMAIW